MSYEEANYHRRRAELELEKAISADSVESAVAHLKLARLHRARRLARTRSNGHGLSRAHVFCTDKEG